MKKYLLVIALVAISIGSVSAQVVWGARVGFSKPTMNGDKEYWKGKFGLEFGPVLYYSLKDNWYLNSGAQLSFKKFSDEDYSYNNSYTVTCVDIPIYAGYAFKAGKVSLYTQAGPYATIRVAEKAKEELPGGGSKSGSDDRISPFNAGLGIMFGINVQKFKIEAGYQMGLTNIWKEDYGYTSKVNSLFLGVSYVF